MCADCVHLLVECFNLEIIRIGRQRVVFMSGRGFRRAVASVGRALAAYGAFPLATHAALETDCRCRNTRPLHDIS